MENILKIKFIKILSGIALIGSFLFSVNALADDNTNNSEISDAKVVQIKNDYKQFKIQKKQSKKLNMLKGMNAEYNEYIKNNDKNTAVINQYKKDIKCEKNYFIKNDKTDLKHLTLNKSGMKKAWKMIFQYKIKFLKTYKKNLAKKKGIVYTTKRYNSIINKANNLLTKYNKRYAYLKIHEHLDYNTECFYFNDGKDYTFTKAKTKPNKYHLDMEYAIHECNGKFETNRNFRVF